MAASKNAKKRRSKNQKKQQAAQKENSSPSDSQQASPERSISPTSPELKPKTTDSRLSPMQEENIPPALSPSQSEETRTHLEASSPEPSAATHDEKHSETHSQFETPHETSPLPSNSASDEEEEAKIHGAKRSSGMSLLPAFSEKEAGSTSPAINSVHDFSEEEEEDNDNDEDFQDSFQPEILEKSAARTVNTDESVMLEAKRQQVLFAKPVMLKEYSSEQIENQGKSPEPKEAKHTQDSEPGADGHSQSQEEETKEHSGVQPQNDVEESHRDLDSSVTDIGEQTHDTPTRPEKEEEIQSLPEEDEFRFDEGSEENPINGKEQESQGGEDSSEGQKHQESSEKHFSEKEYADAIPDTNHKEIESKDDSVTKLDESSVSKHDTQQNIPQHIPQTPSQDLENSRDEFSFGSHSATSIPGPQNSENIPHDQPGEGNDLDDDFDPDLYFSGPEDAIVISDVHREEWRPQQNHEHEDQGENSKTEKPIQEDTENNHLASENLPLQEENKNSLAWSSSENHIETEQPELANISETELANKQGPEPEPTESLGAELDSTTGTEVRNSIERQRSQNGMIRHVNENPNMDKFTPLQSPVASPEHKSQEPVNERFSHLSLDDSPTQSPSHYALWTKNAGGGNNQRSLQNPPNLELPPTSSTSSHFFENSPSSPHASPRPYKYAQSPLPSSAGESRPEPPIFGVCVVGFHHKRGPEVEYWVGPEESQGNMWPYLPFQSLPDGSHQFEENVCYFTLLYDRNKCESTSLTFLRDEEGHIQQGTSDFRNVTTLFAIACSRQVPLSELEHISEDEEYTRSVVQKSVVVVASKPIFGPIKEKLTVVTRSFFNQRNFSDRSIIHHFYENLVQMPLWANENDLQVGMNLQRCVHDFGVQVLTILKAMLLERKILFYSGDTDLLGTTQFALISLIPNLINHLEDSGSPLLSSYELKIQPSQSLKSSDRTSLLNYAGFPLQLFAGGGVFAPFVPLQQFDDLKQPETRYGLFGTANNLFLGNEIDFDVVVNVDTQEIQIRNAEIAPLLKLSDADRAFAQEVASSVEKAWDSEDRWQPQALEYLGGEDYIRHEYEEYLLALLGSAKYVKSILTPSTSETGSINTKSSSQDERDAAAVLQPWNKAWTEKWMNSTNNFRIFDRNTDDGLFHLLGKSHPGQKLLKPSGFERFLGFFKPKPAPSPAPTQRHSPQASTQASLQNTPGSLSPQTPSLETAESFEPNTPMGPRNWFNR